jgi:predicted nucleic acid-binding protein
VWNRSEALPLFNGKPVVATKPQLIVSASRLEEGHTLSCWDALIVQAANRVGAERLVPEDLQNGRRLGVLAIENPFHRA